MLNNHDVKLEFFIGATKRDLSNARRKLIEAVLEASHIPSGMELWSAGHMPILTHIANHLSRCDAHIIILGARYGEYIETEKISYTEWEYQQSCNTERPIIAFLLEESEFKAAQVRAILEDEKESDRQDDLLRFRGELVDKTFCVFFSNTDEGVAELGRKCVNSIHNLLRSEEIVRQGGWIRSSSLEGSVLREIRNNRFLRRVLERLHEFSVLGERVGYDQISKEALAEDFWKNMSGRIQRHGYTNLFFESGSTLAYVSDEFERIVLELRSEAKNWTVLTNNPLILFQFLLYTDLNVQRYPINAPNPREKYGAIFLRLWRTFREPPPMKPRHLHTNEVNAVKEIQTGLSQTRNRLLLVTSSGWDLDHEIADFQGPHVGSHSNMMMKRALFTSGFPTVIFLTAEKLKDPFTIGKCFSVFGPDNPLKDALKIYPLAFCIGYDQTLSSPTRRNIDEIVRKERNDPTHIREILSNLGFDVPYNALPSEEKGAVIVGNQKFKELIPND